MVVSKILLSLLPLITPLQYKSHARVEGTSTLVCQLTYQPSITMGDFEALELTPFSGRPLNICQISVENENDSIIGRNSELVQYRSIKTKIKKKEWVVNSIKSALESFGVQSVSECEGTTIRCTITKMWVEEGSVYKADFLMKVSVEKDDSTLWAGIVADSSNRWGRSMSCALYNETLSNALLGSVYKLLSNTNFQIAIQK